ncbi:hypothetical protein FACS189430_12280 [Bacteroidia bacterium]|nr:hypothetical protein FACS189430_12280 [Bacteroidia bacterium]
MKTNNVKINKVSAISVVVFALVIGFMVGCQKEEDVDDINLPYLELNASDLSKLSEDELNTLKLAKERIEKYVYSDNGVFELRLKSGKQVNISDDLFSHFDSSIKRANQMIKKDGLVISQNRLVKPQSLTPRLKSGNESPYQNSGTGVYFTWYGMDIYVSHADVLDFSTSVSLSGLAAGLCPPTGVVFIDGLLKSAAVFESVMGMAASYYDNGKGFTIICPLYVPSYIQMH